MYTTKILRVLVLGMVFFGITMFHSVRCDGQRLTVRFERKTKEFNEDLQLERLKIVDDI